MTEMKNHMNLEMWMEKVQDTMEGWENLQGVVIPNNVKNSILKFMRRRIKKGLKNGKLGTEFMKIGVGALLYIKMKKLDKI